MAVKVKQVFAALLPLLPCMALLAGEWSILPKLTVSETYSDNVELTRENKISSLVSQTAVDINVEFESRLAQFSLSHINSYVFYSQDHDLDTDYQSLVAQANLALWTEGPVLLAYSSISNISSNAANNRLADIISGDTVESRDNQLGLQYDLSNSKYSINSSIIYSLLETQDNLGESHGYTASINSRNGKALRYLFWFVDAQFSERKNNDLSARTTNINAIFGVFTSTPFSPFLGYHNEDTRGDISPQTINALSSWGPGIRWQVSDHLELNIGYNYVNDTQLTDDYLTGAILWQVSSRSSLTASYNKRFFGNAYELLLTHKTRRLTNNISYTQTIEVFDRSRFQQVSLGLFWCPIDDGVFDSKSCILPDDANIELDNYQLVSLLNQQLVEANEFSVNKVFQWQSSLALAKTTFTLQAGNTERESLSTSIIDKSLNSAFSLSRHISAKGELDISVNFERIELDHASLVSFKQTDYYRSVATSYTRRLARSLSTSLTLQYLDRNSSQANLSYVEARVILNIAKDF